MAQVTSDFGADEICNLIVSSATGFEISGFPYSFRLVLALDELPGGVAKMAADE